MFQLYPEKVTTSHVQTGQLNVYIKIGWWTTTFTFLLPVEDCPWLRVQLNVLQVMHMIENAFFFLNYCIVEVKVEIT